VLSVVTGASYCPRTGAAGWAALCYGQRTSGRIPAVLTSSNQAELWAVVLGLQWVVSLGIPVALEEVVLHSESMWALQMIRSELRTPITNHSSGSRWQEPGTRDPSPTEKEALAILRSAGGMILSVGHRRGGWALQQCHSLSRQEMRRQREYIRMRGLLPDDNGV